MRVELRGRHEDQRSHGTAPPEVVPSAVFFPLLLKQREASKWICYGHLLHTREGQPAGDVPLMAPVVRHHHHLSSLGALTRSNYD